MGLLPLFCFVVMSSADPNFFISPFPTTTLTLTLLL